MASSTEIANMALRHLGATKTIASLSESTDEGRACNAFYEIARDATLREYPWPFALKEATLSLIEEDPVEEWAYSYSYPSDCLAFRRIVTGTRNETAEERGKFVLAYSASATLIYTDTEDAIGQYTVKVTDTARFTPDFTLALSYRLAALICPSIPKGFALKPMMESLYQFELQKAAARSANEETPDVPPMSDLERARG